MSMLQIELLFNSIQGGFSEKLSCLNPNTTILGAQRAARTLMGARMKLSVGPNQQNPACLNPVIPYGWRVQDELQARDAYLTTCQPTDFSSFTGFAAGGPGGFNATDPALFQNLDLQLCGRVKYVSGTRINRRSSLTTVCRPRRSRRTWETPPPCYRRDLSNAIRRRPRPGSAPWRTTSRRFASSILAGGK